MTDVELSEKREKKRLYMKAWVAANPEKVATTAKKWRDNNREKFAAIKKRWNVANRERNASLRREKDFGVTDEQFKVLMVSQKGKCPICNLAFPKGVAGVDHCHKTGVIRGLLCRSCNLALGNLKDDFSAAIRASDYLRKHIAKGDKNVQ